MMEPLRYTPQPNPYALIRDEETFIERIADAVTDLVMADRARKQLLNDPNRFWKPPADKPALATINLESLEWASGAPNLLEMMIEDVRRICAYYGYPADLLLGSVDEQTGQCFLTSDDRVIVAPI